MIALSAISQFVGRVRRVPGPLEARLPKPAQTMHHRDLDDLTLLVAGADNFFDPLAHNLPKVSILGAQLQLGCVV